MFHIAVCDDNARELVEIRSLIEEYARMNPGYSFRISCFTQGEELLDEVQRGKEFHIYLMDIVMAGLDGIEVGRQIRKHQPSAVILYQTMSPDFALPSYGVGARHYLLKPVQQNELFPALEQAFSEVQETQCTSLVVKTRNGIERLRFHTISHVEYADHGICCCLRDGTQVKSLTIRESFDSITQQILNDERFVRPHASFVVNLSQVRTIGPRDFAMLNGSVVPISRKNYTVVKRLYMDFLIKGGDQHVIAVSSFADQRGGRNRIRSTVG